jgi:hypothetical protein
MSPRRVPVPRKWDRHNTYYDWRMSYSLSYSGPDLITLQVTADLPVPEGQEFTSGEISASGEEWLELVVGVLSMLPGKPTKDGSEYVLGPVGVEPELVGHLIAARLAERQN